MSEDSENELVSQLANEYLDRWRNGENPEIADYVRRHPEIESEIREVFPMLLLIEENAAEQETAKTIHDLELEQLGDFIIQREIGRGGMGVVYEAVQESLGRQVALKVCPLTAGMSARNRERFRRESRAAAMLHHTNIVPVFAVGEEDGLLYYAMQFIRGATLNDVIYELGLIWKDSVNATTRLKSVSRRRSSDASVVAQSMLSSENSLSVTSANSAIGSESKARAQTPELEAVNVSLPGQSPSDSSSTAKTRYWESVARIGMQVADALAYAHAQGTLHRDIKPSNLMLDSAGIIWVMDFGLAKSSEEDDLTQAGELIGTLRYMSPEQTRGETDQRSDIYSLGLTLYELLTLKPAFREIHRAELLRAISEEEPVAPRKISPRVPRDLETIVLKAIEKEPSRRYQSARELESDLFRFLSGEPIQARRVSSLERTIKWIQRRPSIASLLTALAILLCVSFALVSWKWIAAERANKLAQQRRFQAVRATVAERKAAALALQQRRLAEDRLEDSRNALYRTAIARAEVTSTTDPATANQLLDDLVPAPGEVDRRDWEWGYLKALVNQQSAVFKVGSADASWVWALAFSDDGSRLAVGTGRARFVNPVGVAPKGSVTIWDVRRGQLIRELDVERSVYDLDFSSDGHKLIVSEVYAHTTWESGWKGHKATIWDLKGQSPPIELDITEDKFKFRPISLRLVNDSLVMGELWRGSTVNRFAAWNAATGERLWEVAGAEIARIEPDGKSVVLFRPRGESTLMTYDLDSGERIDSRVSAGYTGVFSPNLRWLLDRNEQSELIVRNLDKDLRQPLTGDDGFAASTQTADRPVALFSPSGEHFFVGATDGTIRQYATHTKKLIRILRGHVAPIQTLVQSKDGRWLASGDWNGEVRLWQPDVKSHVVSAWPATAKSETTLECVAFRWGGNGFVGLRRDLLESFDAESGARLNEQRISFSRTSPFTRDAAFDASGERLVYKHGTTTQVHVIRVSDRKTLCKSPSQEFSIREVDISGDGTRFALSTTQEDSQSDASIKVFAVNEHDQETELVGNWIEPGSSCTVIALDHAGERLAVAGIRAANDKADSVARNFVSVYNANEGSGTHSGNVVIGLDVSNGTGPIEAIKFSPDGSRIAVCSVEGSLQIFDALTGQLQDESYTPQIVLCDLAWNPSATRIAGVDREKVTLWSSEADLLLVLKGDPRYEDLRYDPSVAFSPDGSKIVASQWNDKINVWRIQDSKDVTSHSKDVQRLARRSENALTSIRTAIESDSNLDWSYAARGQLRAQEGMHTTALKDYRTSKRRLTGDDRCVLFYGGTQVIAPGVNLQVHDEVTLEAWIKNWDHGVVAVQIPASFLRYGNRNFRLTERLKLTHSLVLGKFQYTGRPEWIHVARYEGKQSRRVYVNGTLRLEGKFKRTYAEQAPLHIAGSAINAKQYQGTGLMRSFRVSTRDLYSEDFEPPQEFEAGPDTFLIYDFTKDDLELNTKVIDRSGNGNHGELRDAWWIPSGTSTTK